MLYDAIGRRLLTQRTTAAGHATLPLAGLAPGDVVQVGAAVRRLMVE